MTNILEARNLSLSFSHVPILHNVSFDVRAGEVLGLIGHNGSGKSTIVKVLAGYHSPDPDSEISLRGQQLSLPLGPDAQLRLGLAFVHQDLALIPGATVWENIGLGRYTSTAFGAISFASERRTAKRLIENLGCVASVDAEVGDLPATDQARIAIARAFHRLDESSDPGLLFLDEATNFFDKRDASELLTRVRRRAQETGIGVVIIGHRLDEIMASSDRILVLRDGRIVGEVAGDSCEEDELVRLMVFDPLSSSSSSSSEAPASAGEAVSPRSRSPLTGPAGAPNALAAKQLRVTPQSQPVDLNVARGEVVGLTGLRHAGWEEIVRVIAGDAPGHDGVIAVGAKETAANRWNANAAVRSGVAYVPAEQTRAAVFDASAAENMWFPSLRRFVKLGVLRWKWALREAVTTLVSHGVTPPKPEQQMSRFSGGNRQKIIVAKWMSTSASVLVMDEPTQGVDVHARAQLIERIRTAAQRMGVLVASQDFRDLAATCDRVLVMRGGTIAKELRGSALTPDAIASACYDVA